jgi:hypothetical protein
MSTDTVEPKLGSSFDLRLFKKCSPKGHYNSVSAEVCWKCGATSFNPPEIQNDWGKLKREGEMENEDKVH